jgi:ubiquinone/menaquinone biosynthesis C-methylase UbiE
MTHDLRARRAYWDETYLRYWQERTAHPNDGRASTDCAPADVRLFEEYLENLPLKPGDKVLDVGIGFGRLVPSFVRRGALVYGVDISPQMIAEARRQVGGNVAELCVSAVEELPHADCSVDHVICWAVFDACDQGEALWQMARVLRPGGWLLVSGKNDDYQDDDELAYVAEINARAKGHSNFFTNVPKLLVAMQAVGMREKCTFYFARRGDFSENRFSRVPPARFYEYAIICVKERHLETRRELDVAHLLSRTYLRRQDADRTTTS